MKFKYLMAMLVFSLSVSADEGTLSFDESVLRTNAALKSYKEDYLSQPLNKAFAQSPDGHWNWRADRVTVEMAKEDALTACNRYTKKDGQACVLVNVNGEWLKQK